MGARDRTCELEELLGGNGSAFAEQSPMDANSQFDAAGWIQFEMIVRRTVLTKMSTFGSLRSKGASRG